MQLFELFFVTKTHILKSVQQSSLELLIFLGKFCTGASSVIHTYLHTYTLLDPN